MKTYASYATIEEAYNDSKFYSSLVGYAWSRLYRTDSAHDIVQDAFTKALEYARKRPGKRINAYIIRREVARGTKRFNKKFGGTPIIEDFKAEENNDGKD